VPTSDDSLPPGWQTLRPAIEAFASTLGERGVRYALIGGLAMAQHARPRATDDIDAIVMVPQVAMPQLFEALRERGFTVDVMRNTRELRDGGFTSIRFEGVIVDLLGPLVPAYAHVVERSLEAELYGRRIRIASAEGLAVTKLIAMRPQDESDIKDLLTAYGAGLDFDFIRAELASFTAPNDPRRAKFERWVREAGPA